MKKKLIRIVLLGLIIPGGAPAKEKPEKDVVQTSGGDLTITFIGHGTLMFGFGGKVIHVDPVAKEADYSRLPKADLVLITHEHSDHLDPAALKACTTAQSKVVLTAKCAQKHKGGVVMKNGDKKNVAGFAIRAVPAYNIVHKKKDGKPFHPKGEGNGYLITFGDKTVYVAGDTENIPEMKTLEGIDIAFLPMNLPYTMTPRMVADAAKAFRPKILYPYHFGETKTDELVKLMKGVPGVEVRIRPMK